MESHLLLKTFLPDKVVLIKGNISNLPEVEAAVKGAHVVIHAASLVDVWGRFPPSKIGEVNVHGKNCGSLKATWSMATKCPGSCLWRKYSCQPPGGA